MFCPNCGTQNPDTAAACSACGHKLQAAEAAAPGKPAAPKFKGTMMMVSPMGNAPAPAPMPAPIKSNPPPPPAGNPFAATMMSPGFDAGPPAPAAPIPAAGKPAAAMAATMMADSSDFNPPPGAAPGGFAGTPP